MPKTLPVHQVTWLLKLCAVRTILLLSTILPLELWHMSACTVGDPTSENLVKKSGIIFYPNKSKSKKEKYEGVIYCMFKKSSSNEFVPLYIGKAEKYGKSGNLSENITLGKGKFARWGHGYAYHIGDLSAVAYNHTKAKKPKKYTDWANALFAQYPAKPSGDIILKEKIYFWMQAWENGSVGLWKQFGSTSLTFLEYQLIGVATSVYPNSVLNKEGQNRG